MTNGQAMMIAGRDKGSACFEYNDHVVKYDCSRGNVAIYAKLKGSGKEFELDLMTSNLAKDAHVFGSQITENEYDKA